MCAIETLEISKIGFKSSSNQIDSMDFPDSLHPLLLAGPLNYIQCQQTADISSY